jgi:hypothetical protein
LANPKARPGTNAARLSSWAARSLAIFAGVACTDAAAPNDSVAHAGATGVSGAAVSGGSGTGGASGVGGVAGTGGADAKAGTTTTVAGTSSAGIENGGAASAGGSAGVAGSAAGTGGDLLMAGAAGMAGSGAQEPPKVVLFDGSDLTAWSSRNGGGAAPWTVSDGALVVVANSGDIQTRQAYGDIQLHVEFWIPQTPTSNAEQDRGNSGIYLQGRYEVQVLDSYQHPLDGANDCGAIYELKNADVNAALPAETWQTYEITFRAPRWSGQTKSENARISVIWNGQQAQSNVEVPAPTRLGDAEAPGDAPLRLQDHGHGVRYRNIWLREQ